MIFDITVGAISINNFFTFKATYLSDDPVPIMLFSQYQVLYKIPTGGDEKQIIAWPNRPIAHTRKIRKTP